jgi:peptidoglycan/xylan/chitin deacetylase (PgdA/CDA1 family)
MHIPGQNHDFATYSAGVARVRGFCGVVVCVAISATFLSETSSAAQAVNPEPRSTAVARVPSPDRARTVVSLTFDDGSASQYVASQRLRRHGMVGTFYVNSGKVGTSPYYMTWRQTHALAAAGHEVGGQSIHDRNLTRFGRVRVRHEVCGDRRRLLQRSFSPMSSFAYPDGASNATVRRIAASCGYSSARKLGGIRRGAICPTCPYAETMPPAEAFALRTPQSVTSTTTLNQLKRDVTNAERHGGGWVVLEFYGVCNNACTGAHSLRTPRFRQFLHWLQPRAGRGTVVRTVGQVVRAAGVQLRP